MSELITRVLAPYLISLLWIIAALCIFRPGDWPGGPLGAGLLGGLALTASAMVPPMAVHRAAQRSRAVSVAGLVLLLAGIGGAALGGPTGGVRILSTPGGGLSVGAVSLILLEAGLALIVAAAIGAAARRLLIEARRP